MKRSPPAIVCLRMVVRRHRVQIRFRDLDVVPEYAVVAHLQRVDAGARAFALFQLGDHLLARAADTPQVVESGVEAVADVAAVANQRAGIVDEAAVDVVAHVDEIVQRADERPRQRRLESVEEQPDTRHDRNRLLQADEIARPGIAERGARDETLEILHTFQDFPKLAAVGAAKGELLDGVETIANSIERDERPQQPRAQQPSSHGGDRAIDLVKQGALAAAVHRLDDFEVLQRDGVDQEAVGRRLVGDAADVREIGFLRVAQVVEQGACGRHGRRMAVEAESFETVRPELIEQRAPCGFVLERPRLDAGHRQPITRPVEQDLAQVEIDGGDNLTRPQHHHLVGERLQPGLAGVFGARKLTRRQVEQRDPDDGVRPSFLGQVPYSSDSDRRNAGARSSRCCESVSVPGDTTRTISRLTMPLAFFGSST